MFCPLERVELKVETCPARRCMYKGVGGTCNHGELTGDDVNVKMIADVRQKKPYKIQTMAATAKQAVIQATVVLQYSDYIKNSFPTLTISKSQTVNKPDDSTQVGLVLSIVYGLTEEQQKYFWDRNRLAAWAERNKVQISVPDIRALLLAASLS